MSTPVDDISATKRERFLARLAATGQITRSCKDVGWHRQNAYAVRDRDPEFARRWDEALETFADLVESEAFRRAVTGTEKGVWYQGTQVGSETQYSDALLAQMLKAKRRHEYGDSSKIELGGPGGGPIQLEDSPHEIGRRIAFALTLALRGKEQQAAAPDDGSDMA